MHHQIAEERAKLVQVLTVQLADLVIIRLIVAMFVTFSGNDLVVYPVEACGYRNDDRSDG